MVPVAIVQEKKIIFLKKKNNCLDTCTCIYRESYMYCTCI